MKRYFMQRIIPCVFICILSPFIMGMGCQFGQSGSSSSGFGEFFPFIILLIVFLVVPIVKAYHAAKQADKFKTLVFITTFYEWLGWIICFTIIGIPIGLGLVLIAQLSRVFIQIEANTNQSLNLLKSRHKDLG